MSPSTGTIPTSTSIPTFATIRTSVTGGTPRAQAATMMIVDASPCSRSPTPGINAITPSSPNRIVCARHAHKVVEQMRQHVEVLIPKRPTYTLPQPMPRRTRPGSGVRFRPKPRPVPLPAAPAESPPAHAPPPSLPPRPASNPARHFRIRCYNPPIVAAIVQWQNAALWQRMSWVRNPLAAPKHLPRTPANPKPARS